MNDRVITPWDMVRYLPLSHSNWVCMFAMIEVFNFDPDAACYDVQCFLLQSQQTAMPRV